MEITQYSPINKETHKIIRATYYPVEILYAVPKHWDIDDIYIKYTELSYKGEDQDHIQKYQLEQDLKYTQDEVEDDDFELDQFFDCEEE